MKNILLIVANASRARLYRVRQGQLERLESLNHPESRAKIVELVSDRQGRQHDDSGPAKAGPHRSGVDQPVDPHENEMLAFAREVARRVSIQARRGKYPEVIVFAPPRFLGRVKAALEDEIAKRVVASVSHDYTTKDENEIVDILQTLGVRATLPTPV